MATAPNITEAAWGTLNSLTGTINKFTIALRWDFQAGVTLYDIQVELLGGTAGEDTSTIGENYWNHFAEFPVAGDYVRVRAYDGSFGPFTTISLDPIEVFGPDSISGDVGGPVFGQFALGSTLPTTWAWSISGAPSGVTITDKGTPEVDSDGGLVTGVVATEGVYEATVVLANYNTDAFYSTQQYPVKFHISGERYIEDFHTDTTRTAINIRHPKGTAASWNFNAQTELDVTLGDSFTLHAILRNGTSGGTPVTTAIGAVTAATSDLITRTAHGLAIGDRVRFTTTTTLPAGLSLLTDYYVIASGLTANDFKVSTTNGGSAVDITDTGTGTHTVSRYDNAGYLTRGVTNLRLIAKLPDRRDGPAILSATSSAPVPDTYDSVTAWPLTFAVESERARRLFEAANTPVGAATDSGSILLTAQISYTYGGRAYRSLPFAIRLAQPISQL